jgi:hypothetical protein
MTSSNPDLFILSGNRVEITATARQSYLNPPVDRQSEEKLKILETKTLLSMTPEIP